MRIEKTPRQTPEGFRRAGGSGASEERFVWEVLAPRLLQPSKLAFIQALLRHGRPLTLGELADAANINEEHADYQCKSMQRAGVLEVVSVAPGGSGEDDEPSYFFPKQDQATSPSSSATTP